MLKPVYLQAFRSIPICNYKYEIASVQTLCGLRSLESARAFAQKPNEARPREQRGRGAGDAREQSAREERREQRVVERRCRVRVQRDGRVEPQLRELRVQVAQALDLRLHRLRALLEEARQVRVQRLVEPALLPHLLLLLLKPGPGRRSG